MVLGPQCSELDVEHPAVKLMASEMQDGEVEKDEEILRLGNTTSEI